MVIDIPRIHDNHNILRGKHHRKLPAVPRPSKAKLGIVLPIRVEPHVIPVFSLTVTRGVTDAFTHSELTIRCPSTPHHAGTTASA